MTDLRFMAIGVFCWLILCGLSSEQQAHLDTHLIEEALAGNLPTVKKLLDQGANPNAFGPFRTMATYHYQAPVLVLAAIEGNHEIVEELLSRGADIDAKDELYGATALHYSSGAAKHKVIEILVEAGAYVNMRTTKELGKRKSTPLMYSAKSEQPYFEVFLSNGADPNIRNVEGETALLICLRNQKCLGGLEVLLKAEADTSIEVEFPAGFGIEELLQAKGAKYKKIWDEYAH